MGIMDRFNDILQANIYELVSKAEDPGKMVYQYILKLNNSLAEVKREMVDIAAEETRARRLVDENATAIRRFDRLSRKALLMGNHDDTRVFITKKQQLEAKATTLQAMYDVAHGNAQKMRLLHDKLVNDLEFLNIRREAVRAKVAVASTQDKINQITTKTVGSAGALGAFNQFEEKANRKLDEAIAMSELNQRPVDRSTALEEKYAKAGSDADVEREYIKLRKEMGL